MKNIKGISLSVFISLTTVQGCATNSTSKYHYFPELAQKASYGDSNALRQVLELSETTSPGEQLEELAEISSKFVRINPTEYLRVQSNYQNCFGVEFLGYDFVDSEPKGQKEKRMRREALNSITDSNLETTKLICLGKLNP